MRLNRYTWQDSDGTSRYGLPWSAEYSHGAGGAAAQIDIKYFWSSGESKAALVERSGRTVVMVSGFTGLEIPQQSKLQGMPGWFYEADEYLVMLANPFSEELKREVYYKSHNPRAVADGLHADVLEAIGFLRQLLSEGRRLKLRFYNGVASLSQWMFDSIESITAVRDWSRRFDLAWSDAKVGEFDFDAQELVFVNEAGKVLRRLSFSRPPKLPYFDDEGALVISF